ncbi:MAG: glycosyltransferase family 9 protein, partial [Acidobacteriaceae bacterium]|nr:glycosyltransferase family 9 protein [Acidobacteriaceae bacterium]
MSGERIPILVIRLSAMGDIIHALPAVASLKKSFPDRKLAWLVAPRWMPLLEGNPSIDELIPFDRSGLNGLRTCWQRLRNLKPELVMDFQGLVQSAIAGRAARPSRFFGFDRSVAREPMAAAFYTHRVPVIGPHRVQRNLQLIESAGASRLVEDAWIPPGIQEGSLPMGPFVLANPFAGWASKQWPIEYYEPLAQNLRRQGLELIANVSLQHAAQLSRFKNLRVHTSSLAGLIAATRRASAVVGLDSGPVHLAAALHKPGVALFGPTDPARTGPYGGSMGVLRAPSVETTYKRGPEIHPSMRAITP